MINILPDAHKLEIRAGRMNVRLIRYFVILGVSSALLAVIIAGAYFVLITGKQAAQTKVDESELKLKQYESVKEQADSFKQDLSTAKTILDGDITYSQLIYAIADTIPKNVVLDNLKLDSVTLGSKATFEASAKTYIDGVRLKEAFVSNNTLYSDVFFETLSTEEQEGNDYPVKVMMSVVIKKEALK